MPMNTEHAKLWTKPYVMLIIVGSLTSTGFYMVNPCIAKYAVSIGSTIAQAGIITGFFSITALLIRPISGMLADRCNQKVLLLAATTMLALAALGYSFAHTVPILLLIRILHGVAFAISGTVNVTLIAGLVPRERISEGIGYFGLANIFATAIGPSVGLGLGDAFGYTTCFRISSVMIFCGLFFAAGIQLKSSAPSSVKKSIHLSDLISLKVLPLAILGGLFSMSNGIITSYLALLGDVRGIVGISLYFTVNAAVLVFVRPFSGRLADKKGAKMIVYPAMALDGLALFTLGQAMSLPLVLLAAVSKAVGQGSGQLTLQSESLKMLPPQKSGVASSTFYIGGDIGQGLGPMFAGKIVEVCGADSQGYGVMFSCSACMFILGILLYWVYNLRVKSRRQVEPSESG